MFRNRKMQLNYIKICSVLVLSTKSNGPGQVSPKESIEYVENCIRGGRAYKETVNLLVRSYPNFISDKVQYPRYS